MSNERKAILKGVIVKYYCPYLGKVLTKTIQPDYDLEYSSNECDICGSHGYVQVDFKCKCGNRHELSLKNW